MKSIFISHTRTDSEKAVLLANVLAKEKIVVQRVQDLTSGSEWQAQILSAIRRCSLFVAFVDEPSPNVMLELGYALGASKQVFLVASSEARIPFDVASMPVARFDRYDMFSVYEIVEKILSRVSDEKRLPDKLVGGKKSLRYMLSNPDYLEAVSPQEFESIVVEFFNELGFEVSQTTGPADGGYDILLRDPETSVETIVEVRKYSRNSRLGVASVHQLLGSMVVTGASSAILVSTSGFSASALNMAERAGRNIKLLTIDELARSTKESITKS